MVPGPKLRALGIAGIDLKDAAGNWLAKGPAVEAADALLKDWDAIRAGQPPSPRGLPRSPRSCAELWGRFEKTPEFAALAARTRRDYASKARVFLDVFGPITVEAVARKHLKAFWRRLYEERGHAMANGVLAVARLTFSHGEDLGWIPPGGNPAARLRLRQLNRRAVVFEADEAALIVATADATGRPSVADAFVLALHQGQRPGDIIALSDRVAVTGRLEIEQAKRGKHVSVKLTPLSQARARAALERKKAAGVVRPGALLIDETTGRPYRDSGQLSKRFAAVRAAAAAELVMQGREDAALALMGKIFYDTRGTYLTRAHGAKVDAYGRAAVSGHSRQTQVQNEEHYVAGDQDAADAAQDAYVAWMNAQEIEV